MLSYQGVGTMMVQRSQTAMERRTQLVGDCIPCRLRMMMMMVLEMRVTRARSGHIKPCIGTVKFKGPTRGRSL